MRKIYNALWIVSTLFCLLSCEEQWDKHYEGDKALTNAQTDLKIMDWLKTQPEYSAFCALMEETGVSDDLNKDQVLTCWAVSNDNMPDLSGKTPVEKKQIAQHHVNFIALYTSKLSDGKLIKTLAGKNIYVTTEGNRFFLDGHEILTSQMCANGIVHILNNMLVPRINIYEYIERAGAAYSTFRDTLFFYNDTVFRPDLSFPIGVDETGNTVYDSIFRIENRYMSAGDYREENTNLTLFLPSNETIHNTLTEITDLYRNVYNSNLTMTDSIMIFRWIMRSVAYEGKITDYHENQKLESLYKTEWRTDIQQVEETPEILSNGLIYHLTYLHIPNYLLLTSLRSIPSLYKDVKEQQGQEAIDRYFTLIGQDEEDSEFNGSAANGGYKGFNPYFTKDNKNIAVFFMRNNNANYPADREFSLEWTTLAKDRFGIVTEAKLVPGKYKVKGSFRTTSSHELNLYIDDEFVATFNASNSAYSWKSGDIGEYTYKGEVAPVRIKLENAQTGKTTRRITVQYIELVPDEDNY